MQSKDSINQMPGPSINEFLREKYWTIQESVFVLRGWPQFYLTKFAISQSNVNKSQRDQFLKLDRSFFYGTYMKSDSIQEADYSSIHDVIKEDIDNGLLFCETLTIPLQSTLYFIVPFDVIKWALLKGYTLPRVVQEAIGVFQNNTTQNLKAKTRNLLPLKIREKIVAQFFLLNDSNQEREKLCRKVLKYFENKSTDITAIRNNLNELYETPGKKGRRKNAKPFIESYRMKAIPEILTKDDKGNRYYDFPLLYEAMKEAAILKCKCSSHVEIPDLNHENIENWKKNLDEFMNDPVVNLYSSDNEYVKNIIVTAFSKIHAKYLSWLLLKNFWKEIANKIEGLELQSLLVFFNRNVTELN